MDAVPEDLRCKRSDGKQWRCSAPSMPDKTVCEKHYVQAKKRAASSALRATLRRSSPSYAAASYAPPREGDADADLPLPMAVARPFYGSVVGEPVYVAEPAVRRGLPLINAIGSRTAADLKNILLKINFSFTVGTVALSRKHLIFVAIGYAWYSDIAIDDIQKVCPACRGICNCKVCLQGDNVIKARVQEISVVDKLKYLHSILAYVLPVLKQIYSDQCFEIGVETRAYDIRRSQTNVVRGEYAESKGPVVETNKNSASDRARLEPSAASVNDKLFPEPIDANDIGIRSLFPTWRANNDGSITCGPHEAGGCGSSKLVLRRIFKINWIDSDGIDGNSVYSSVLENLKYEGIVHFRKHWINGEPVIIRNAFEPSLSSSWDPLSIWRGIQEIMDEKMDENAIVKAVDCSNQSEVHIKLNQFIKGYSDGHKGEDGKLIMLKLKDWPPVSVLEEFLLCQRPEFIVNFPLVDFIHSKWGFLNLAAKLPPDALQSEVGLKLLIAYGRQQQPGKSDSVTNLMVKMGDVVHMLMHRAEMRYLCPKSLQPEQPERIANGMAVHVNAHAPVQNLNLDMGEQSPEHTVSKSCGPSAGSSAELSSSSHSEQAKTNGVERSQPGALWDVFRRQDVPMLNKYLASNWEELTNNSQAMLSVITSHYSMPNLAEPLLSNMFMLRILFLWFQVKHPIYDQAVYLREHHKRVLKDQYGIEPRTFEQHIGEAVFIPAGCPYQVKNLQSTVQLALDFLSPESLRESARMAQEIRCLPNHHDAKLKMLEVGKIALYAASSAVKEIQKITLDPKFNLDIRFEDQNLTRAVSENLARVTKQRKVSCG
ncbi:Lysine-specific demethylase 3B [Triticum urartu]|uniref:Lysine-specific demethylase 3B n=1 Tax=Triticum urartu TaxID=4572 RepID=M8A8B6_TRIUA|nr:Lysine-specific demethylase 3B [Triticum urartu]